MMITAVKSRIQELKLLQDGWLDGKGKALNKKQLDWFCDIFENSYPDNLPLPYIYPAPEGGIQLEWTIENKEISLEIDLASKDAEWHLLNLFSGEDELKKLDLNTDTGWNWLINRLIQITGESSDA